MKIVLFAVGGSYTHTNLGVRCLSRALSLEGYTAEIIEGNLRDKTAELLYSLYSERADVYGFSCYIWNIREMVDIANDLRALLPSCKIIFGGPEVSYNPDAYVEKNIADIVICGPGEDILPKVCKDIEAGKDIPRVFKAECQTPIPSGILYGEGELDGRGKGTLVYYESSRGCPFSCAYCLSSVESGVIAKNSEQTLSELLMFETLGDSFSVIKFVDRTFNFDIKRAKAIWRGLLDDRYTKRYHFEVCASLLDEECFEIFSKFPKDKLQLEVGLQSTNPSTLSEISRHLDVEKTLQNCKRIKDLGNIHLHLDLIAGLPFEDFACFRRSFDEAYFACHKLQLGFLKLLHGTALRINADKYGYKFLSEPPYTVLESNWITYHELHTLLKISDLLERYNESGGFDSCLDFAVSHFSSPFDFYLKLSEFIDKTDGRELRRISQADAYFLLFSYVSEIFSDEDTERFSELMHGDFCKKEVRKPPRFLKNGKNNFE